MEAKPFLAGSLVGAAAGALLGTVLARPPAVIPRAPVRTSSLERRLEAVENALDRLARDLRRRGGRPLPAAPEMGLAPAPALDPAADPAADADATAPATYASDPDTGAHFYPDADAEGPLNEFQDLASRPANRALLKKIAHDHAERLLEYNSPGPELHRRYQFLTYREVLAMFGRPDLTTASQGGAVFHYKLPVPNAGSQYHLRLTLVDGMVLSTTAMTSRLRRR